MAKKLINSVRSTVVDEIVGNTILGEYTADIDNFIWNTYNSPSPDGVNFAIPDVISCCNMFEGLREKWVKLYDSVLGNTSGVENIPDEVKVIQGSLLDGLVFGYDASTGKFEVYTANFNFTNWGMASETLQGSNYYHPDRVGSCICDETYCNAIMKSNLSAKFKCLRVDVEYFNGGDEFRYDFVNHRKILLLGDTYFIPYLPVLRAMKFIEGMMNKNKSLLVLQQVDQGGQKARVITEHKGLLGNYCDDPSCVGILKSDYYPLKGFMYAPCLGAPSTTAMCTSVNLFNLDRVQEVSEEDIQKLGIKKPDNPLRSVFSSSEIDACLRDAFEENPDKYWDIVTTLPRSDEFFGGNTYDSDKMIPRGAMMNYIHSLKPDELHKVESMIPGVQEGIARKSVILRSFKEVDKNISKDALADLLKNNVCRVVIRKKDCTFSSLTLTNNVDYLKIFYGDNYIRYFESFNVRVNVMINNLRKGYPIRDCFEDMGFELYYDEMVREKSLNDITPETLTDEYCHGLRNSLSIYYNESIRQGYNLGDDTILARSLFAVIANNGSPVGYYRNITISTIVKLLVME